MKRLIFILFLLLFFFIGHSSNRDTTISSVVQFSLNSDELTNNEPGFKKYVEEDLLYLYNNIDSLVSIKIISSTSPEGTFERNTRLANNRAKRITDFLPSNLPIGITYEVANSSEILDYVGSDVAEDIKGIIESNSNINKKLSKTKYYHYLFTEIYPKLRYTKIEMVFHLPEEKKEEPIILTQIDTIYLPKIDTLYLTDTVYIEKPLKTIPILALKTNLIGDAVLFTNIQAELYTWINGISLEFSYGCPWWKIDSKHLYYQTLNGKVTLKKYFFPTYTGFYFGIYGHTGIYDYSLGRDDGYQGEYYGGGLTAGFVFVKSRNRRIKFEPYFSIGIIQSNFDKYHANVPFDKKYYYTYTGKSSDFVPRRFNMDYFGPTAVGFNLTYDLICLRRY